MPSCAATAGSTDDSRYVPTSRVSLCPDVVPIQLLHRSVHIHCRLRGKHHPAVIDRLQGIHALIRIHAQKASNEILRIVALIGPDILIEAEDPVCDVVVHALVIALRKWMISTQPMDHSPLPLLQNVRNHTQRPHVHRGTVPLVGEHLWSHVSWGSAVGFECVGDRDLVRQAKVSDADRVEISGLREQEVLRLQVAMNDAALVAVVEGVQEGHHAPLCLRFAKRMCVDDGMKQLSTEHQVLHQIEVVPVLPEVMKTDDVGMATKAVENRRFSLRMRTSLRPNHHCLHNVLSDVPLLDSFQGDMLAVVEENCFVHNAILAYASDSPSWRTFSNHAQHLHHLAEIDWSRLELRRHNRIVHVVVKEVNQVRRIRHQILRDQLFGHVAKTLHEIQITRWESG